MKRQHNDLMELKIFNNHENKDRSKELDSLFQWKGFLIFLITKYVLLNILLFRTAKNITTDKYIFSYPSYIKQRGFLFYFVQLLPSSVFIMNKCAYET